MCGDKSINGCKTTNLGILLLPAWRSVTKVWRTLKVRHTIKCLIVSRIDAFCDEVPQNWKKFFLFQLPLCYTFAVAPLCLHFFIYVRAKEQRRNSEGRAKEQRRNSEGRADPPPIPSLGRGSCLSIFAYLKLLLCFRRVKMFTNCMSTSRRHLEGISKASRTHADGNDEENN